MAHKAVGIDIGGTGIKGAIVDVSSGKLLSQRIKLPTPTGGEPDAIVETVATILSRLAAEDEKGIVKNEPVGICFPAVVVNGRTLSAANVSKKWIGLEAEKLFEAGIKRDIHFVNDADAAGYAESVYGAAKKKKGLVLVTTLGTGIGTALIYNGVLVPNAELGHLEINGVDYETQAAYSAKERESLSWADWAARLQVYYDQLVKLFHPDLIIVGGGVSKEYEDFLPLLKLDIPIVPATLRNNAGILGAAALASGK
ncbi:polyphosphate--glucose phosphotransferase [Lacisediminihabitans changchengi]|uniref:ROK family protein n=1 Tax=Lacisediminihabitans changchengi TaxID=2787634 RepID=A0A934VYL6_9MICO|nr:ROK family protein [Lacisediminihabitans changchengi]MBK4346695.1 ROK family protein [Lacisediminihabitans changchengi]MBK4348182.1 ROK family protein [Lacisediminihabitans changchengi]